MQEVSGYTPAQALMNRSARHGSEKCVTTECESCLSESQLEAVIFSTTLKQLLCKAYTKIVNVKFIMYKSGELGIVLLQILGPLLIWLIWDSEAGGFTYQAIHTSF
jgi:hypothetical protein